MIFFHFEFIDKFILFLLTTRTIFDTFKYLNDDF